MTTATATGRTSTSPGAIAPAGPAKRRPMKSPYPTWFFIPAGVFYVVLFLVPTIASFYFSLTRWTLFDVEFIGFDNFVRFFQEPQLVQGFINTFIYAFLTSGLKVVLGLLLGVFLSSQIIGRGFLRATVFFPVLVSTIGVGILFQVLMDPFGGPINEALAAVGIPGPGWLTDPSLALISVALVDMWKGVGLATLIYIAGMVAIPQEYFEAAKVDGAGAWNTFRHITLPLLRPATVTVVLLSLIGGLRSFDLIWTMTGGGPGLHERRARFGRLQAVPGRLLRPLHRGQRRALRRRRRDHLPALVVAQPEGGRAMRNVAWKWGGGSIAILVAILVFIVPFAFIVFTAGKTQAEASFLEFSWPTEWVLFDNIVTVLENRDFLLVRAFVNSTILTVAAVAIMVVLGAMVGYVLQRRKSRWNPLVNGLVLAGLIIPPAVVPTIWTLQGLGLFKTLVGLIAVHVAFGLSFCILLFRAFVATIPRELDEAAIIDGAGSVKLFFRVIFPLLEVGDHHGDRGAGRDRVQRLRVRPVLPSRRRERDGAADDLQLQVPGVSAFNLLFANVLLITIPPLIMYIIFQRQIVAGMTSGAVKG